MSDTFEIYTHLLAQENLKFSYSNTASTAYFDMEARTVCIPLNTATSEIERQLMVTHEVGHALYTKYSIDEFSVHNKRYGSLFNIIEDVYIEKQLKKNYAGTSAIFKQGYKELFENDFFGELNLEMTAKNFCNRINIHSKLGSVLSENVQFNAEEIPFVLRLLSLNSNDDVIALCEDIYKYLKSKKDEEENEEQKHDGLKGNNTSNDESEQPTSDLDEDENKSDIDEDENEQPASDLDEDENEQPASDHDTDLDEESDHDTDHDTDHDEDDLDDYLTSESMDNLEEHYNSARTDEDKTVAFVNIASKDFDTGVEDISLEISKIRHAQKKKRNEAAAIVADIKAAANAADGIFQMKKSTHNRAMSKTRKTGILDTRRLSKYKTSENLFKNKMILPNEQNHAAVILIDFSRSIVEQLMDIIRQTAIMGQFCYANDIPFEIISFGLERLGEDSYSNCNAAKRIANSKNFSIEGLITLGMLLTTRSGFNKVYTLGCTPTGDALLAAAATIKRFKQCGYEKTFMYIITDGKSYGNLHTDNCSYTDVIKSSTCKDCPIYCLPNFVPVIDNIAYDWNANKQYNNGFFDTETRYMFSLMKYIKESFGTVIGLSLVKHSIWSGLHEYNWRKSVDEFDDTFRDTVAEYSKTHNKHPNIMGTTFVTDAVTSLLVYANMLNEYKKFAMDKQFISYDVNLPFVDQMYYYTNATYEDTSNMTEEKMFSASLKRNAAMKSYAMTFSEKIA